MSSNKPSVVRSVPSRHVLSVYKCARSSQCDVIVTSIIVKRVVGIICVGVSESFPPVDGASVGVVASFTGTVAKLGHLEIQVLFMCVPFLTKR